MGEEREKWIDIAKGWGVFLVILGHMPSLPSEFRAWIFSFHMPLFYFLSGRTYKVKELSLKTYICKQARGLLVPYFAYSAIFIFFDVLLMQLSLRDILKRCFNVIIGQGGIDILWFFVSLFWVKSIFQVLRLRLKNIKVLRLTILLIVAFGLGLISIGVNLPLKIGTSLVALLFYWVGYESRYYEKYIIGIYRQIIFVLSAFLGNLLLSFIIIVQKGMVLDMNFGIYNYGVVAIITGLMGCIAISEAAKVLERDNLWINICAHIGKNSLYYYPITGFVPTRLDYVIVHHINTQMNNVIKICTKMIGFLISLVTIHLVKIVRICKREKKHEN